MKEKENIIILCLVVIIMLRIITFVVSYDQQKKAIEKIKEQGEFKYGYISENAEISNIFDSFKEFVYDESHEDINSFSTAELFTIIGYNIKDKDIKDVKKDGTYSYGYIKKELLDKRIETIFGKGKIKITKEKNDDDVIEINAGKFKNTKNEFRNAVLLKEEKDRYYFRFLADEGNVGACGSRENIPIKIIKIFQIGNDIVIEAKAVQTKTTLENDNDSCLVEVMNKKEQIDSFNIKLEERTYTIDIDKYQDKASDVYIYLREESKGKYRFSESKIG